MIQDKVFTEFPVIETTRLILRPITKNNAKGKYAYFRDKHQDLNMFSLLKK